jgi:uroporphyrinogen-III decarboxylase
MALKQKNSIEYMPIKDLIKLLPIKKWLDVKSVLKKRAIIEAQSNNHSIKLLGLDSNRFATEPDYFLKTQLAISAYYGFDKPCIDYDLYTIEAESLGQKMIYSKEFLPEVDLSNPLIAEKNNLYSLKPSISKNRARFDYVLGINKLFKDIFEIAPRLRFCGPFSLAVSLRGYSNLMIDMEDDKGFVKDLFDFIIYEVLIPWVKLLREDIKEPEALAGAIETAATFPNISRKTMDEWIIPYYELAKEELGNITFTTCCGGLSSFDNSEEYFSYQTATNPGIIKGYGNDLQKCGFEVFNKYAKRNNMDLRLAISAQTLLSLDSSEVEALVKRYLEKGGIGLAKYSIFLSDIDPATDPRTIVSLVSAVKQLGIFPIREKVEFSYSEPEYKSFNEWFLSNI